MLLAVNLAEVLPELPVSYVTILVAAIMLIGFIAGLVRGFGVELLGLIKMAGAIFGAAFAVGYVQPLLSENIDFLNQIPAEWQPVLYYLACMLVIWLVLAIIAGLIKRLFMRKLPGKASKFFGGVLGMVKAALVGIMIVYIVLQISPYFEEVNFFISNAKVEPVGQFLVENNPIVKIIELVKGIIAG